MDPKNLEPNSTKLNWKRIIDEIPEVHEIIATGNMHWVKESRYDQFPIKNNIFDKQSFVENFATSDISCDKLLFEQNKNLEASLNAIKAMQAGMRLLMKTEQE